MHSGLFVVHTLSTHFIGTDMTKTIAALMTALFLSATVAPVAFAADDKKASKPSAEACKKDPKMAGCEAPKK
jgi:hypothetical protein